MRRGFEAVLGSWKAQTSRKPMVIQGARQVGKTTLVSGFGVSEYPRFHVFNFEKDPTLSAFFESDLNPLQILKNLEVRSNAEIKIDSDLIFFDEIQACPRALTSLKYFAEEHPNCHLIAAGSLLGLQLGSSSFPVGKVQQETLFPLSFRDFLNWKGAPSLAHWLSEIAAEVAKSIAAEKSLFVKCMHHDALWQWLKLYMALGGMPEVVAGSLRHSSWRDQFVEARAVQEQIVQSYFADMAKHAGKVNSMHLERLLRSVPAQMLRDLNGQAPKFQLNEAVPGVRSFDRLAPALDWLQKAGLVHLIKIANSGEQPASAFTQDNFFKVFCFDVGILGSLAGLNAALIQEFLFGTYKGFFAENFALMEVKSSGLGQACCWREGSAEIEFLFSASRGHSVPLEIKSGHRAKTKSLQQYLVKYQPQIAIVLSGSDTITYDKTSRVLRMPVYFAGHLRELIV